MALVINTIRSLFLAGLAITGWMYILFLANRVEREIFWKVVQPVVLPWFLAGCGIVYLYVVEIFIAIYGASENEGFAFVSDGVQFSSGKGLFILTIFAIAHAAPGFLLFRRFRTNMIPVQIVVGSSMAIHVGGSFLSWWY